MNEGRANDESGEDGEMAESKAWRDMGTGLMGSHNEVLDGDGFYISYASNPGGWFSLFEGDGGSDETALVDKRGGETVYLILNGDYRREYEALIDQGFDACKAFYDAYAESRSSWSSG